MAKKLCVLAGLILLMAAAAEAQDAMAVLRAASTAMGAGNVRSIQYTGTGWGAPVGQGYTAEEDWPRLDVTSYKRVIDYENRSSSEEWTRRQGNNPPRGGGGVPVEGDWQQSFFVSGEYAWNMNGNMAVPAARLSSSNSGLRGEARQLDIWLSPHGFLKAAMAAGNATAVSLPMEGQRKTIVSFTAMGKYRVNGTITADNMVERVQTWIPNPVFGDMVYEHRYTEYKDYNGVKFPTILHSHQGDPRIHPGHNSQEVRVTSLQVNPAGVAITVPNNIRQAPNPATVPVRVQSQQLANGVWLVAGESHNSVAVEFRDFVTVVEAPQDEKRSLAVIAEVQKLVPSKPIQYVVNTHYHFDHSGGLRTYVAQGATVVTHAANREFYEQVFFYPSPRTLEPDLLSARYPWFRGNRVPAIETVTSKYVISDGVRTLDIHVLQGVDHEGNMMVAYLPTEKILINADLYGPPAANAQLPAPNANIRALHRNIQRLKLDVQRHVPIHGQVGNHDVFLRIANQGSN
jgi:glyoxylase-like metal-dependent hydrolase (beta-lactamase superfamily II)